MTWVIEALHIHSLTPNFSSCHVLVVETSLRLYASDKFLNRNRSFITLFTRANRHRASLRFFRANDEHIWHFLKLRVSNLRADLVVAHVQLDPQLFRKQPLINLARVVGCLLGDR